MQLAEVVVLVCIVAAGIVLSLAMRHVRQPLAEVQSSRTPESVFEALQEIVPRTGYSIEAAGESGRAIVIRAKIKCFDILLYRVWADRIIINVTEGIQGGSRLIAMARPAPLLFHARERDPLFINLDRLVDILAQASETSRAQVTLLTPIHRS